jgi:hypothetical protein
MDKTICLVCKKKVYPTDLRLNLDGALYHTQCAKCADCGCQITLDNFTNNRMNTELLCKIHYKKRFLESGGVYHKYNVTPAFEDVIKAMRDRQQKAEKAHREEELRKKEEDERLKREEAKLNEKPVIVTDDKGNLIDIDEIVSMLASSLPPSGNVSPEREVSENALRGESLAPKDEGNYRTLYTVKAFDM